MRGAGRTFAVFATISPAEFARFQAVSSEFRAWHPLSAGSAVQLGDQWLEVPQDWRGIYALGERRDGLVRILIWDEKSGMLVAILASGFL